MEVGDNKIQQTIQQLEKKSDTKNVFKKNTCFEYRLLAELREHFLWTIKIGWTYLLC